MELQEWIDRKRESLRLLSPPSARNLTPSIRDFYLAVTTQRQFLAVVAEIARATPEEGALGEVKEPARLAEEFEACGVAAVAVATDEIACGGSIQDLARASPACSGPVVMRDLVLSREQLYLARLAGSDAVLLTAAAVEGGELRTLMETANSMHMACPVEVRSEAELLRASHAGARLVVIPAFEKAALSLELAGRLLPKLPRTLSCIIRGPFARPEDLAPIRGRADAIWLAGPLIRSEDRASYLSALVEAAGNA